MDIPKKWYEVLDLIDKSSIEGVTAKKINVNVDGNNVVFHSDGTKECDCMYKSTFGLNKNKDCKHIIAGYFKFVYWLILRNNRRGYYEKKRNEKKDRKLSRGSTGNINKSDKSFKKNE